MARSQSNNMWPDNLVYKNRLQEYTQQSGLSRPLYQTINEGFSHAPKFTTTVLVNGTKYTSKSQYPCQKLAEQEAAKLAYESITAKSKDDGCPLIYKNPIYCKSILHEYAVKMNFSIPKYKTTYAPGPRQVFVSSFVFNDKTYTGEVAQSKKEAEQLVARTAIESLLGSDSGTLVQIIKSKERLFHSLPAHKEPIAGQRISPVAVQRENSSHQQASSVHRAVITFGSVGTTRARPLAKRKVETNNWEQRKRQ